MQRTPLALTLALLAFSSSWSDDEIEIVGQERLAQLIERVRPSVATIKVNGRDGDRIAMGTGFVVDSQGVIATNFHVIGEGRPFKVEMSSGRRLKVLAVEASDRNNDLALIRVDVGSQPLKALKISDQAPPPQGTRILAFGNPLGMRDSVVTGIVSALREVEGRQMIQLAMPVEPGNSGGPLVDTSGRVRGIVNMKSAIDDNLGFAIPIGQLDSIRNSPNPVTIDRWVRLGSIRQDQWTPLFGARWQQRGGIVTVHGSGDGFGGRSLCLATDTVDELPMELAVDVRMGDESGAAGLAFHSDGEHRHYGFYPSNGRLRLTCFKGPSVYSWQVLQEVDSEDYLPNHWNRLRVRIDDGRLQCFCNGKLAIEISDRQLVSGRFGLVKFRDTQAEFKSFQFGAKLPSDAMSDQAKRVLSKIVGQAPIPLQVNADEIATLSDAGGLVSRELARKAVQLEQQANRLRRLSSDVQIAPTLRRLRQLMSQPEMGTQRLLKASLLIAQLDHPEIDIDVYVGRVDEMAEEIRRSLPDPASAVERRDAMHRFLFEENGFHGGRAEYYHPANSHLNRVIDDREGLPITLSIMYIELGQRLDLNIEGIGLPGHFVVRHVYDQADQLIDVFERGQLVSQQEARRMVATYAGREMTDDDLRAQTTSEILSRVLNNLIGVASRDRDIESIYRYCEALVAVNPTETNFRMLRAQARAMTKRDRRAIEDIDWMIEHDPVGLNHNQAIQLRQVLIQRSPQIVVTESTVSQDESTETVETVDRPDPKP